MTTQPRSHHPHPTIQPVRDLTTAQVADSTHSPAPAGTAPHTNTAADTARDAAANVVAGLTVSMTGGRGPRSVVEQITDALTHAAGGTGLAVIGYPDLQGASVRGARIEAYVYPCSGGGLVIDLWRHEASDPFAILRSPDLIEAAQIAVTHAAGPQPHAQRPSASPAIRYAPTI